MVEWFNRNSRAIVILCNVSVVLLAVLAVMPYLRHLFASSGPPAPAVGSRFALFHGGSPASRDVFYVAMSAHCSVCEREAGSYRSLEQALDAMQGPTILYLMPEEEAAGRSFMNRHGLRGGVKFGIKFRDIGIRAFPTVLLVNHQNVVQFSHAGSLRADDRQRLETALSQCSTCMAGDGQVSSGK
jgi:hypothetical protein